MVFSKQGCLRFSISRTRLPLRRSTFPQPVWEATLAIPYNWWNYQHRQMMGIFIGAWSGLPIEGACVWIAATYATAVVFEVVKVVLASERSVRDALLGEKQRS